MFKVFPLLTGIVIVLASGIAEGLLTDRWKYSDEPEASARKVQNVAPVLGDWEAVDGKPLDDQEIAMGKIVDYISRIYTNRVTGTQVTLLIVCGRPGPIAAHTPDICFVGAGQFMMSKKRYPLQVSPTAEPMDFWVGHFQRVENDIAYHARTFWSYSANGTWVAPDSPRLKFPWFKALYKIYVQRQMEREDENLDEDKCNDFLKLLMPELQKTLFGKESGSESVQ